MTYEFKSKNEKSVFLFLDELRKSGACNMFESGDYVRQAFPRMEAKEIGDHTIEWMRTFSERNQ